MIGVVMAKSICFFNHKGGVSKTTTTFNLGWVLASNGFKVLMVDLDSQCNLTGMVLGFNKIQDDSLEQFYSDRNNLHMGLIVDTIISGGYEQPEGSVQPTNNENLFLLPGHIDVSELDQQISVSLKVSEGIPATRNIPGMLPKLISSIADQNGMDYVIYDLSPNIGGLNQIALMSSDYFIVPTSPDFFCWQAVGSLAINIPKWHYELGKYKKSSQEKGTARFIKNQPQFLGTIHQRYRPRNGAPAASFQKWVDNIRSAVDSQLVPKLTEIGCIAPREKVQAILDVTTNPQLGKLDAYDLAHISDFNSLIAISQEESTPVFELSDQQIIDAGQFGHALATMRASRDQFNLVFDFFGKRIIELTS